jgi:hypothetical protein
VGWIYVGVSNNIARTCIDEYNYYAVIALGNAPVTDGNWHFLCSVKDGAAFSLYQDGVLQSTITDPTAFSSTENYHIGDQSAWPTSYSGLIDDVRIYSRALAGSEILSLYQEGGWAGSATGSGGDSGVADSNGVSGTPVPLASGQNRPYGIAVDSTNVYWLNSGDGTVMKVPIGGGTPETLSSGQQNPATAGSAIAVDGTSVYWTGYSSGTVVKLTPK